MFKEMTGMAWCNQSNVMHDSCEKQYSILPRAILLMKMHGNPHKANKSNWTDKLQAIMNLQSHLYLPT